MRSDIEIKGLDKLQRSILALKKAAPERLEKMLAYGAINTENSAKQSIQAHQSSGAEYRRRTITHTASTPGNPPNSDTGNLVNNITVRKISGGYDVGSRSGAPYGVHLEYGTRNMQARPWLLPAFLKTVNAIWTKLKSERLV